MLKLMKASLVYSKPVSILLCVSIIGLKYGETLLDKNLTRLANNAYKKQEDVKHEKHRHKGKYDPQARLEVRKLFEKRLIKLENTCDKFGLKMNSSMEGLPPLRYFRIGKIEQICNGKLEYENSLFQNQSSS